MNTFAELRISPPVCEALRRQGITAPTPVQERAIPIVRSGQDAIVQSQTGTGKTLAFLLPIMEKLKANVPVTQAVVISPTRELAVQTAKTAARLGEVLGVKTLALYGGQDIERQKQRLGKPPQIIIGTPGRLLDHLRHRAIDLSKANKVVLDEADEMLKRGFLEDVETLLMATAKDRQFMLFSATMPERIRGLAHRYMHAPQQITVKSDHITLDNIRQLIVDTTEETKLDKLCALINQYQPYLALVFCHTRQRVAHVAMALAHRGYLADELHGDMSQAERTRVLNLFRTARLQILVATDVAARGLDIEGITHVFNYDIPQDVEWYIHRIGRTGRAGREGMAITFVNARQYDKLRKLEAGIQRRIDKQRPERRPMRKPRQHRPENSGSPIPRPIASAIPDSPQKENRRTPSGKRPKGKYGGNKMAKSARPATQAKRAKPIKATKPAKFAKSTKFAKSKKSVKSAKSMKSTTRRPRRKR